MLLTLRCIKNSVEERMLERAAQKLRLDQLVIQQGRTQINKGNTLHSSLIINVVTLFLAANKEELMEMITHGAEKIINSTGDEYVVLAVSVSVSTQNVFSP